MSDAVRYLLIALVSATWAVGWRTIWLTLPFRASFASAYHVYVIASAYLISTGTMAGVTADAIGQNKPVKWYVMAPFLVSLALGLTALLELHHRLMERQKEET